MKQILVYSHDTFGLGNIRRTLATCNYLINSNNDLSILLISGSPMIQSFRIPDRIDYIKLPCLSRPERESYASKYIKTSVKNIIKLRSEIILAAATNFRPDLVLVDKKPSGIKDELQRALVYLKLNAPETKLALILRDILDSPTITTRIWQKNNYFDFIQTFYDTVLVLGMPEVFDPRIEYCFPKTIFDKVQFCGYIKQETILDNRSIVRKKLQLNDKDKLVLVTPGGGEDGSFLIENYVSGLSHLSKNKHIKSLIIYGPQMPTKKKLELSTTIAKYPYVSTLDFTDNIMNYMHASDLVVCMGGYNTISEVLSLKKKAIIIPRISPTKEQWIRANQMANMKLLKTIHPDKLTSQILIDKVITELGLNDSHIRPAYKLNFNALEQINSYVVRQLSYKHKGLVETEQRICNVG